MIVRPYEPEHLLALDLRDYEMGFLADFEDLGAYAEIMRQGVAYTLWDARPLGCFGIVKHRPGVGEGWICFSNCLPIGKPSRTWVNAVRTIHRQFDLEMAQFHRVQTAVPARFVQGQRLVRRLGFSFEAVLRRYGSDGADFFGYVRVS